MKLKVYVSVFPIVELRTQFFSRLTKYVIRQKSICHIVFVFVKQI